MPCGLYGKLPAKRDFIAVGASRAFLAAWEPWLQGSLSASRASLAGDWQQAYLRAPIWRFWLGANLCGMPVLGAMMPSVDGIGRYFPLTVFDRAEGAEPVPPPELDPFDAWFADAEILLLSALAQDAQFDDLAAAAARLPPPGDPEPAEALDIGRTRTGTLIATADSENFAVQMARLRPVDHVRVYAAMTYWWTAGGEGFPARIVACRGMPDPYLFSGMLTGRFDEQTL